MQTSTPTPRLTVLVEKHVPFVAGLLEPYATVIYADTDEITPEKVKNVNCLLIRSRTVCDENLLANSRVGLIVTATIGTDHIDMDYCSKRGISVINAPGCNAPAVAQYVIASIVQLSNRPIEEYTLGIVGVGNVGKIVERWARSLGMKVLLNDPPREREEGGDNWCSLEEIAEKADIITFHTPLVKEGQPDSTYHLANGEFFNKCRRNPVIINAARGAIVDTPALVEALESGKVSNAVIDCWEGEPDIDRRLLDLAAIATTHIAGWSHEGKVRASQMAIDAISAFYYLPRINLREVVTKPVPRSVTPVGVLSSFDPLKLTVQLKAAPEEFETIRNTYRYRNEAPEGVTK